MTGKTRLYTTINALLLIALFAGSAWAYPRLPERIPMHFDVAGRPDRWEHRSLIAWFLLPLVAAALSGMMHAIVKYGASRPELWNVPEKRRFLALDPAHREPVLAQMREFMALVAAMCTALIGTIQVGVYHASRSPRPQMPGWMMGAVGAFVVITLVLAFRVNHRTAELIRAADAG